MWFYWNLKWPWTYSFRMHIMNVIFFIEINSECSLFSDKLGICKMFIFPGTRYADKIVTSALCTWKVILDWIKSNADHLKDLQEKNVVPLSLADINVTWLSKDFLPVVDGLLKWIIEGWSLHLYYMVGEWLGNVHLEKLHLERVLIRHEQMDTGD